MKLRCLIVEDEPPAMEIMQSYVQSCPQLELAGCCADAVDYLVKPFSFDRFLKAVNKAAEKVRASQPPNKPAPEASRNFILLRAGKNLVIHETIKGMLDQLPPGLFLRIHKSYVVAVDRINYIEGNQLQVGNSFIPIGRSFKEEVECILFSRKPHV